MARAELVLYFDMHSPFSYLAFHVVNNSPAFKQCQVEYVPILLAGLVNAIGAKPPWAIKNKAQWVHVDRIRWARQFGIPMAEGWPEKYPDALTLEVQRAICACKLECPNQFVDVVAALYSAFWGERKAIQLETGYRPILEKLLGMTESEKVLCRASTDEVKTLLKNNTTAAVSDGACGLPWMVVIDEAGTRESFWGFDHLGQVATSLGLGRLQTPHL